MQVAAGRLALRVAEKEYKRGGEVRASRKRAEELLEELQGNREQERVNTDWIQSATETDLDDPSSGAVPGGGD